MEQRLINADKLSANICKWLKPSVPDETEMVAIDDIGVSVIMEIEEQPTVFEIPENPTNGDMIKALFPKAMFYETGIAMDVEFPGDEEHWFNKHWWNAPYKRSDENANRKEIK